MVQPVAEPTAGGDAPGEGGGGGREETEGWRRGRGGEGGAPTCGDDAFDRDAGGHCCGGGDGGGLKGKRLFAPGNVGMIVYVCVCLQEGPAPGVSIYIYPKTTFMYHVADLSLNLYIYI